MRCVQVHHLYWQTTNTPLPWQNKASLMADSVSGYTTQMVPPPLHPSFFCLMPVCAVLPLLLTCWCDVLKLLCDSLVRPWLHTVGPPSPPPTTPLVHRCWSLLPVRCCHWGRRANKQPDGVPWFVPNHRPRPHQHGCDWRNADSYRWRNTPPDLVTVGHAGPSNIYCTAIVIS